jgi:DNA-nicking Smr family endonuclease
MMKQIDMHGKRIAEVEEIFFTLLNESRMKAKLIEVMFITGTGAIQEWLKQKSSEQDLYHYVVMANRGCIVVEFE